MFVSVVIPIYNGEKYLDNCIESILRQNYERYELILIDDGSTDRSLTICQEWELKDKRISVYSKENAGVSDSRNYGIEVSCGDYILFVDCDDLLSENYISQMVNVVKEYGQDVLPISVMEFIGEKEYFNLTRKQKSELQNISESITEIYDRNLFHSPCNKLYCKSIIVECGIKFRTDINLGEDLLFNVEYLSTGKIRKTYTMEDTTYYYRAQDSGTLCNRYDEKYFENQIEQFKVLFQLFDKFELDKYGCNLYKNYDAFIGGCPSYYWKKAPKHRLKKAREILKTEEYKESLLRRKNDMHRLTWYIYKSNNVFLILLMEKIYLMIHQ